MIELALMPDGEYAYLGTRRKEAVQGDVPRFPERNHQLPQITADPASCVRVRGKHVNGTANRRCRRDRCRWIVLVEKQEQALDIVERARRVDYPRHAFGRGARLPAASRSIQAWTSRAA